MIVPNLPLKYQRRARSRPRPGQSTPPAVLVLVGAIYDPGEWVELTFNQAIDIGSLNASHILVDDGEFMNFQYAGWTGHLTGPATVRVVLTGIDEATVPDVRLSASPDTGIVAVNGGGTWEGVHELELPFG